MPRGDAEAGPHGGRVESSTVAGLGWGGVVQGAGAGLMFPQALTGIQLNFSGSERTHAIGLYAIALSAGAVTGQVLGGLLIAANNVPPRYAPDISGVSTTFMQIGGAMAVAAVGTLYLALAAQPDSVRATSAFAVVSLVLAAVALAAAAAARRATHMVSDEPGSRS